MKEPAFDRSNSRSMALEALMRPSRLLTPLLLLLSFAATLHAQYVSTWDPDADGDDVIGVNDLLALLSVFEEIDEDDDGIFDSQDDCVGAYDACGVCNGVGEDTDMDGVCDDIDLCVGGLDECGVCNGPGPSVPVIDEIVYITDSLFVPPLGTWYVYSYVLDTLYTYVCPVPGCTDPLADLNYNPLANVNDNSCGYFGCTSANACNYDVTATVDDGTCVNPDCEGGCSPMGSISASGGCVSFDGGYAIHTFTSISDFSVYQPIDSVSILIVGGGGGGQGNSIILSAGGVTGAGAGAGGVVYIPESANLQLAPQTYSIAVGQGGTYGSNGYPTNGGDSSMNGSGLSLVGKGGGSSGGPGGCGGGQRGGSYCSSSFSGVAVQAGQTGLSGFYGLGYNGSPATTCQSAFPYQVLMVGGAGGGAGGPAMGRTGGVGFASDISGEFYVYSTGGGNNVSAPSPSNFGDGGRGGSQYTNGVAGVVIIRYKYE